MNIGRITAIFDRERKHFNIINFFLIASMWFRDLEWSWYYLLAIPAMLAFMWFDVTVIWPKELEYQHMKSPVLRKIVDK